MTQSRIYDVALQIMLQHPETSVPAAVKEAVDIIAALDNEIARVAATLRK